MTSWNPLDNPEEVGGLSGGYYTKTFNEQDKKRQAEEKKRLNEEKKRQQQQVKQKADAEAKAAQIQAQTVNPLEMIGSALAPVGDAIIAPFDYISDRVDEFGEAVLGKEEMDRRRKRQEEVRKGTRSPFDKRDVVPEQEQKAYQEYQAQRRKQMDAPLDALRVPAKAAVAGIEGLLDISTQAALDLSVNRGKDEDEYIRAAWDFGVTPKTQLGKAAASLLSFGIATRAAGKALGKYGKIGTSPIPAELKGAKRWAAKGKRLIADGLIPGAIADFILTDPTEGNLSTAIQQLVPEEYRDSVWFALAAKPEGNPFKNRLLSMFEGGPLNPVGNIIGGLIQARFIGQAVKNAGGSAEEALAKGVDAFTKETDRATKVSAQEADLERVRWTEANEAELNQLLSKEADISERLAQIDPELDPDEAVRLDAELQDVLESKADLEGRIYQNADSSVQREYWETQASQRTAKNVNEAVTDELIGEFAEDGTGRISKAARGGRVLTDAQIKIMNLEDGQQRVISDFEKKVDIEQIARNVGRTVDEVKATAEAVYNRVADQFMSYEEVLEQSDLLRALAEAGGTLVEPKGVFATAEGAIAVKHLLSEYSKTIYDIAYGAEQLDYSSIGGINNYDRLIDRFVGLLGIFKESANYHGAGLGSFKIRLKSALSDKERAMMGFEEADELTYGGAKKWAENIKAMARRGDPEAQDQLRALTRAMVLAGGDPANTISYGRAAFRLIKEGAETMFYNNILSGVKTMIRNFSGITRVILDPAAIALRGAIKGDEATVQSGLAGLAAVKSSIGDAWTVAKITFDKGIPAMGTAQSVLDKAEMEATIQMMETVARNPLEQAGAGMVKLSLRMAQALQLPSKLLMSTDDFVSTIVVRQRIAEKATFDAIREAPDVTDRAGLTMKYLEKYSQYFDPQTGRVKDKGLQEYAEIATFKNNPGQAVNMLGGFIDRVPFGRYIIPFLRTPANIMKYQLEYLPFTNAFSKRYADAVKVGDELTVAELEGRMALGTLVASTGFLIGLTGGATGNLPIDPDERKRWNDLRIRPRSFKVGDAWVSYNSIEPLNNVLAAAVDLAQWAKLFGEDVGGGEMIEKFFGQLTIAVAGSFTDKSYFKGFEPLAALIDIRNLSPEKAERAIAGFTYNQAVPWASLVRGAANSLDPYMREYDNEWRRVFQGNIPLLRNMAPPMIDILTGRPMKNPYGNPWNANVPFEVSVDENDAVKQMLMKARYSWRERLTSYKGVTLSAEQKKFVREQMYDYGLRKNLSKLMKQDWFNESIQAYRNRSFDPDSPATQPPFYRAIAEEFNNAKTYAFQQLEAEDRKFQDELTRIRISREEQRRGIYRKPESEGNLIQNLLNF